MTDKLRIMESFDCAFDDNKYSIFNLDICLDSFEPYMYSNISINNFLTI